MSKSTVRIVTVWCAWLVIASLGCAPVHPAPKVIKFTVYDEQGREIPQDENMDCHEEQR